MTCFDTFAERLIVYFVVVKGFQVKIFDVL